LTFDRRAVAQEMIADEFNDKYSHTQRDPALYAAVRVSTPTQG
jgi:hypothetical protein